MNLTTHKSKLISAESKIYCGNTLIRSAIKPANPLQHSRFDREAPTGTLSLSTMMMSIPLEKITLILACIGAFPRLPTFSVAAERDGRPPNERRIL